MMDSRGFVAARWWRSCYLSVPRRSSRKASNPASPVSGLHLWFVSFMVKLSSGCHCANSLCRGIPGIILLRNNLTPFLDVGSFCEKIAEDIYSSAGVPFTEAAAKSAAKSAASLCCCHTGNVQRLAPARRTVHALPFHYICKAALRLQSRPTLLPRLPVSPAL